MPASRPSNGTRVTAWQPRLPGVREVLHARLVDHAYPSHTHDAWTLLIVDDGVIRYDLDRHEHGAVGDTVTLLPPGVPHDGRSVRPEGFRKRVVYLEPDALDADLVGAAVDRPELHDGVLRDRVHRLHGALRPETEQLEAASRLALIRARLAGHLRRDPAPAPDVRDPGLARAFRDLIDARSAEGVRLEDAAALLNRHPVHLVRAFTREYGLPPHRYLTGRRVDAARRYLLAGHPVATAATLAGFYDQSHLNRHFVRFLGVTPAAFARG
ncbi:MAG TPA: AraC family transcriptional regulator [Micromonosporaceae bacterium]|nr:AraC family transcriptional regulator [Micromonosporaceae bacterium]